jgi:ribosome-associated protein
LLARLAQAKKAENILILDLRKFAQISDYFVIASGTSARKVITIAEHLAQNSPYSLKHWEGQKDGLWVLLDFGSVVCHIFHSQTRDFYRLENLWSDAAIDYIQSPN